MSTEETTEVIDMRTAILMSASEPTPTKEQSLYNAAREPIKARTKAEFDTKVKELLKAQYPSGSEVNVNTFIEKYAVKSGNLKRIIGELTSEGYPLTIPIIATMGPNSK